MKLFMNKFVFLVELAVTFTTLAFLNAGQICMAPTRIFVQISIYDKFVSMIVKRASSLKVGGPFEPDTFYGSQVKLQNIFLLTKRG